MATPALACARAHRILCLIKQKEVESEGEGYGEVAVVPAEDPGSETENDDIHLACVEHEGSTDIAEGFKQLDAVTTPSGNIPKECLKQVLPFTHTFLCSTHTHAHTLVVLKSHMNKHTQSHAST